MSDDAPSQKFDPLRKDRDVLVAKSPRLLAVDLGLVSGWATFDEDGLAVSHRAPRFADVGRLKRSVKSLVPPTVTDVFVEGDRHYGDIWGKAAARIGATLRPVSPERWRRRLLLPRERRSGADAKAAAEAMAKRILMWSGAPPKMKLRTDAAEAIVIGLYGVLELGWLADVPDVVKRRS